MIKAIVVDDERLARDTLRIRLRRDPDVELVAVCRDAVEAISAIRAHAPDVLFLDVQMPGTDGFGVLDALDIEPPPVVVFVTAWDTYALRAFEQHALDYLLKPFDDERFQRALERAKSRVRERRDSALARNIRQLLDERYATPSTPQSDTGAARRHDRIMVKERGRFVFLPARELEYVRAAGNYLVLFAGGRRHYLRSTMNELMQRLDPGRFLRIHRSTIVSLDFVKEIQARENGTYRVRMNDGAELILSRTYRDAILHHLP
ncbi:MAG: LytTR family transcriptional regulator DNA-binding domain-containing protein [Gemmatimonadetes bacterium]|nr:LytTR family transcriptional regulator DNA-binding domain-containing protein [Gemmatimonadota bacterium]